MMKSEEIKSLPFSAPGTTRSLKIIRYGTPGSTPKVYIQAGLHADEAPGYIVAHHLEALLDQQAAANNIAGEIILVPAANPIGLSQWQHESLNGRFDQNNGINFNRNHLDLSEQIATEVEHLLGSDSQKNIDLIRKKSGELIAAHEPVEEASALKKLLLSLSHDADIVLDLHCDLEALIHLYLGTPLWEDGKILAECLDSRVNLVAANSGGGPFDEANSRIWWDLAKRFPDKPIPPACFAATVELRGFADTNYQQNKTDAQNLMRFLGCKNVFCQPIEKPPENSDHHSSPLTGVDYVKATEPGIICYTRELGAFINKGEVIATVINPLTENNNQAPAELRAQTSGILFSRSGDRFAHPGRIIAKIAGMEPLRDESGTLLTM